MNAAELVGIAAGHLALLAVGVIIVIFAVRALVRLARTLVASAGAIIAVLNGWGTTDAITRIVERLS